MLVSAAIRPACRGALASVSKRLTQCACAHRSSLTKQCHLADWSRPIDKYRRFCDAELVILDTLDATPEVFAAWTGWNIKPEGACKGDVCVPLPDGFSVAHAADRLGMALVRDDETRVWALGPEAIGGRALSTAEAPELVLPDVDGTEFQLSSLRGQKVVLVSWAPY
jgi:hypothetical protein